MPRGTRHIETGTLRLTPLGYTLEMDGGGRWRLDMVGLTRCYRDQRVTVDGTRASFDLLDVRRIWLGEAEERPPSRRRYARRCFARLVTSIRAALL